MRFFVLPIFGGVIMDGPPIFRVVDAGLAGIQILDAHYDTIEMGKTKNLIFYSYS